MCPLFSVSYLQEEDNNPLHAWLHGPNVSIIRAPRRGQQPLYMHAWLHGPNVSEVLLMFIILIIG